MLAFGLYIFTIITLIISVLGSVILFSRARDLAPLLEKKEHLLADISSAQNTLSDLEERKKLLMEEAVASERTIAEAKLEKKWLDENRDTVASLRSQIEAIKNNLKECTDKFNEKNEEFKKLDSDYQELLSNVQNAQLRENELSSKIRNLNADIEATKKQKTELTAELSRLEKTKIERMGEITDLQNRINELKRNIEKLENDQKAQTNALAELTAKKEKTEALKNEIDQRIQELEVREKELNKRVALTQVDVDDGKHRWEDLDRDVVTKTTSIINKEDENTWLEKFASDLQDKGIIFNRRTINAFHTGLKVADASPIVVLAGISGTGKSLLPRLYAHAIGMNYVQSAVQPRWDNPSDMLGFYNYMEGRFKATELSRFLWQFDIYNNEKAAIRYKENPPMNLILLDEMNLARVEYYFSDMLSKLEVRRGLDPKDRTQRKNAEIEIECGASNKNTETRHLFIGSNTLFVGTMNEDETTQALSDKVMDRSNVLRFGRPEKLESHPDIDGFMKTYPERQLLQEQWKSWQANTQKDDEELREIMQQLNDAMSKLNRPFAHRVWQAVDQYVANYPKVNDRSKYDAMADQVEMKILPKLQGIEKEDSKAKDNLASIRKIIEENIRDDDLTNAYEQALQDNNPFFQWHGIVR